MSDRAIELFLEAYKTKMTPEYQRPVFTGFRWADRLIPQWEQRLMSLKDYLAGDAILQLHAASTHKLYPLIQLEDYLKLEVNLDAD